MKENTLSLSVGGNSWSPLQESMNFSKALCFYILVYNADYYFTDVILFPIYFYIEKTSIYPITAGLQIANDYGFTDGWKILVEFLVQSMI